MPRETGPFQLVWALVRRVPRGRVTTYGQLSQLIGGRLSPLAVGWAVRAAPEGSIPWHRVINARGGVSTDADHPGLQRALLEAEGVRFSGAAVDLAKYQWRPRARAARRSESAVAIPGNRLPVAVSAWSSVVSRQSSAKPNRGRKNSRSRPDD